MLVQDGAHITGIQQDFLSPSTQTSAGATKTFGTANRAYLYPFWVPTIVTITNMIYRVVTASGNMDLGIYDKNGNRVASTGSFAMPASGRRVTVLSATLYPHLNPYYWAVAGSSATGSLRRLVDENATKAVLFRELFFDTSFPLPSSLTLGSPTGRGADWQTFSMVMSVSGGTDPG